MDESTVTVAIPVLNGEPGLEQTLRAVRAQRVERPVELLVADSESDDRSVEIAHAHGAEVMRIARSSFSHGGTRNELVARARGTHVAFLTQDAVPADEHWLAELLAGFSLADDVGLVCGSYLPRPGASHMVRRELGQFFRTLSPRCEPRIDRRPTLADPDEAVDAQRPVPGPASFFTDANGCVARAAWERVPFRRVPYAEDQLLAIEMMAAGFAKVFQPHAAVIHSHDYPPVALFRRCFDEWRGLREVYDWIEPASPGRTLSLLRGQLRADWDFLRCEGTAGHALPGALARSLAQYLVRAAGSQLGSRADRLPPRVRMACSLERRASFEPYRADRAAFAAAHSAGSGGQSL